ncbi:aldose epimerase family protein [Oceanobacillus polygoni]|uniref:Aldose 1-epimerase n=1 Tax=Oceanobacillus polygoni TaxID=1235259 RepID=A0A9X1CG12_9BACI|nr:aldose epimerase family protein [Oceanobacillus polygoni]MBP2078025.1 aldose 1-epimerase [Oceanobacillus polygoni]
MKLDVSNINVNRNQVWKQFTLTNDNGMTVEFINYGCIITKIRVPDKNGIFENVVLGYENYLDYAADSMFLGAVIGRVAGRIKGASFQLDGKTYRLAANNGNACLHGGAIGLHQVIWEAKPFHDNDCIGVHLYYQSVDGESGFPGNVRMQVTYSLNNANQFTIHYHAETDQKTPLALTNHSYFNLSGNLKQTIHNHYVVLDSNRFAELDDTLLPTGMLQHVEGTSFDFRKGRELGQGLNSTNRQNQVANNGYDHYFIFNHKLDHQVVMKDFDSGRVLSIKTNEPGVVMYTSNTLRNGLQFEGSIAKQYLGVCFETQTSPASLHHERFPNAILQMGETYDRKTIFTFTVED